MIPNVSIQHRDMQKLECWKENTALRHPKNLLSATLCIFQQVELWFYSYGKFFFLTFLLHRGLNFVGRPVRQSLKANRVHQWQEVFICCALSYHNDCLSLLSMTFNSGLYQAMGRFVPARGPDFQVCIPHLTGLSHIDPEEAFLADWE